MKPNSGNDHSLRVLLDDVVPSGSDHCGPGRPALMEMVRRERTRRRRVRHAVLGSIGAAWLAIWALWQPVAPEPPLAATPPAPRPVVIQEVNDQQLLSLLEDTPAALMEWPDGQRTLLVVGK